MKYHENKNKMYYKFNDITKDLEAFGKEYSLDENIKRSWVLQTMIKKVKLRLLKKV